MIKKNESTYTRWLCEQVEAFGAKTIAFVGNKMQQAGLPDRYICHPLFRGWTEMKLDDNGLTTLQRIFLEDMRERGDNCLVVRFRRSEIMEIENIEGNMLAWVNLTPLYATESKLAGKLLLEHLYKALINAEVNGK